MKLRVNDEVLITAGKDKSQRGRIERVLPKIDRVVVTGRNIYKRARKGFTGVSGGMIEFSRPLSVASVALLCPQCSKPTRVTFVVDKKGGKTRVCAKCRGVIEGRTVKK